jgi:hypothetical protein
MNIINKFSSYLFWDVDISKLDTSLNAYYIIPRVMDYGRLEDVKLLNNCYDEETIKRVIKDARYLKPSTISLLALMYEIPLNEFRALNEAAKGINWK